MDLNMGPGKLASQAGHAYLGAYLKSPPDIQTEYHSDGIGTKICLECPTLEALRRVYDHALSLGLPAVFIEDSGNNTIFNGVTTATAVGIGPCTKAQAKFLKRFQLHK
jgi:peptidyl-tRNA hydrolase